MGLELRQQLKLSQQLVMTPQLQQAIKLLQLSRLELLETVQQELMENPFLDEIETETEVSDSSEVLTESQAEEELVRNADWENYLGEFSSTSKQATGRDSEIPEEGMSFEARLASKPSLEGHLNWQMRLSNFTEQELAIGEIILGNVDSNGYLQASIEELQSMVQATDEEVESTIKRIQRLDPVGVAARTPQECLLVQMDVLGYDDPILVSLVTDHLEDLEKNRYKPLTRKFKISMDELKEYLDMLQTLDPMPGSNFSSTEPHYVSPDVFVYKYGDDFVIILNEDGLPRLQMNAFYMDSMKGAANKEKEYFQEKMRSAAWLMKSLYQRQRTLYKVVESIVRFQREFFEEGVTKLKPLILKEVAENIEMHESTVSRITTSKYVSTPHGIFELKFFFNSALDLNDGSQVGSESVKALIKKMIAGEDTKKPLSDERIGEILQEKLEVNIARRTVAKYRSAMGIPSSSKRKQYF
ncbi:RNA polymerase factor sigma-54 [uncultured Pseudodesulfovibrio sp.]|uniref:RNA polymerase factor sigma-54 n=1 Tax=uncultured Pseudodesulfovibrio sp. TaxID=2035858 RepID=UPI0029C84AFB|nr:RNA polymerase factor sigma-54 [uncultured Pseudodesulfovibrio sp.]